MVRFANRARDDAGRARWSAPPNRPGAEAGKRQAWRSEGGGTLYQLIL